MTFLMVAMLAVATPWAAIERDAIAASAGRSRDELFGVMKTAENDVATCLRASSSDYASVRIAIEATGVVSYVDAQADEQLATCLQTRFRALRFAPIAAQQIVTLKWDIDPHGPDFASKELIRSVVQSHASKIRHCYERALSQASGPCGFPWLAPHLAGKVKMKWVIVGDGSVSEATVESDEMGSEAVTGCLIKEIKTWVFPKPKGGGKVIVSYPFVFKQSG